MDRNARPSTLFRIAHLQRHRVVSRAGQRTERQVALGGWFLAGRHVYETGCLSCIEFFEWVFGFDVDLAELSQGTCVGNHAPPALIKGQRVAGGRRSAHVVCYRRGPHHRARLCWRWSRAMLLDPEPAALPPRRMGRRSRSATDRRFTLIGFVGLTSSIALLGRLAGVRKQGRIPHSPLLFAGGRSRPWAWPWTWP